jgi:hypothetical protein
LKGQRLQERTAVVIVPIAAFAAISTIQDVVDRSTKFIAGFLCHESFSSEDPRIGGAKIQSSRPDPFSPSAPVLIRNR